MKAFGRILSFLILLAIAGAAFYFGWIQFKIDMDTCGVLISKTGGVYEKPIVPGVFSWRWEPLLPTNAKIRVFSLSPKAFRKTSEGALPSANVYSLQIKQAPDFSYKFDYEIVLRYKPYGVVQAVKKTNVSDDEALNAGLEPVANQFANAATLAILEKAEAKQVSSSADVYALDFAAILENLSEQENVEIVSFRIISAKIPDFELYEIAKQSYTEYRKVVEKTLALEAVKEAQGISADNRNIQKLEKMGELFRRYPELTDVIKSGASIETLQSLQALQ